MSRRVHHAIIVSTSIPEHAVEPYNEALRIFGTGISPILYAKYNGVASFYIPPDGSSDGWAESQAGDARRDEYLEVLTQLLGKGVSVQWVEVRWGDDDGELPDVVTHSTHLGSENNGG
jgi:hypothetical protein